MSMQVKVDETSELVSLGVQEATVQVLSRAVLGFWEAVTNLAHFRRWKANQEARS